MCGGASGYGFRRLSDCGPLRPANRGEGGGWYGGSFGWFVVYQDHRIARLCDVVCGCEVSVLNAERAGVGVASIMEDAFAEA